MGNIFAISATYERRTALGTKPTSPDVCASVAIEGKGDGGIAGAAGFVQMGYGALVSQFISCPLEGATSAMPLMLAMLAQGVAGVLVFLLLVRRSSAAAD